VPRSGEMMPLSKTSGLGEGQARKWVSYILLSCARQRPTRVLDAYWVVRFRRIETKLDALRVDIECLRIDAQTRAGREDTSTDLMQFPLSPVARPN
jgi:hypothetical protein